jgi:hypothetical protein
MERLSHNILARHPWLSSPGLFSYGFTAAPQGRPDEDAEIALRLIEAYRRATADNPSAGRSADVWTAIGETQHGELIGLIDRGDARAVAAYLRALPRRAAGHGFWQGEATFNQLLADPKEQRLRALWFMDNLVGMAEAVGVLAVRCPEHGEQDGPPSDSSAAELRAAIEG